MTKEEKKAIRYVEQLHDHLIKRKTNYTVIPESSRHFKTIVQLILKKQEKIEQLEKENTNLKQIQGLGLNKEKQYCFNEDGHTRKCLGYSNFNDDEPCIYCKTCDALSIKEDD